MGVIFLYSLESNHYLFKQKEYIGIPHDTTVTPVNTSAQAML